MGFVCCVVFGSTALVEQCAVSRFKAASDYLVVPAGTYTGLMAEDALNTGVSSALDSYTR